MQHTESSSSVSVPTLVVVTAASGEQQLQPDQDEPKSAEQQQPQQEQHTEHQVEVDAAQAEEIQHVVQRGTLTWATTDEGTRVDGANVVSLAGHEGSVIVLGKMQDGQLHTSRDDCQDILLMVELKYKDVLTLPELQAQGQVQPQTDGVHLKPHTITYATAPKTRIINYVTDPQQPGIIKAHPQLAYTSDSQTLTTNTVGYTDDQTPITIGKTHLLAYDAQGNAQTIAYPSVQPLTIAKAQALGYITDAHSLSPSSHTVTFAEGSQTATLSKDQTLTFTSGTAVGPNTHVISFVPEAALGRAQIVEYTTEEAVTEQAKITYVETDSDQKIMVFEEQLSEHVPETMSETILPDPIGVDDAELKSAAASQKPFPCPSCNKRFMRRTNLRAHMAQHTSERPHTCETCGKSFAMRWDLTLHCRLHTGMYQCDVCGKAFAVRGKLERHRRVHSGERPFSCTHCGKAFSDKHNLEAHVRTHSDQRPYACQACGRTFRSRSHLRAHRRVHTQDTPFTCHLCGKSFKWKANLNLHLKVHTGERVKCDGCGREFTRRGDLVRHRRSHEAIRPHACTICPRTYSDRAALNKHLKSHQEHRPFTCDICHKSFHFMWYLNSHKKMHSEEKKFKCNICDKEFTKRGNLTTHVKLHHANLIEERSDSGLAAATVSTNSMEAEDSVHSSMSVTDMKVEVNMADMKVDVAELTNVNPAAVGVINTLETVNPHTVVTTNMLNDADI